MSWRHRVKARKRIDRPPIWHPEPGESIIEIVDEPDEPIHTRFGDRLPLVIRLLGSGDTFTWLIPWRDEVGPESLLGQLKMIADEHNGLKGLKLKVIVAGSSGAKRYRIEALGGG